MSTPSSPTQNTPDGLLALSSIPQRALVRALLVAHQERTNPAKWVHLLAAEFGGPIGMRMNHLAMLLKAGTPVADALEQTPGILAPSGLMAIRLASETGTLSETYEALISDQGLESESTDSSWRNPRSEFTRVLIGFIVAWFILAFMMIFIMPTFEKMFDEFGLDLPPITRSLILVSHRGGEFFFFGIAILLMLVVGRLLFFGEKRPHRFNPFRWHERFVPPSVNLLSLLAIVVGSGRPIASGLETLAKCHHVPQTRRRLAASCERVERGEDPWTTLANERILTSRESQALSVAGSSDVQAWLLQWLAESRFDRRSIRRHLLTRAVSLASLLLLAAVVAWVCIAIFLVLTSLIGALA
ncbi:type II secretion system F family protein [Rhodopirellula bahusiensis]|uniref:type II secretion system F family protein n=2 Tax=Rhodopirellula bahusiensis TaxID=2014065 RepID=UPI003262DDBB